MSPRDGLLAGRWRCPEPARPHGGLCLIGSSWPTDASCSRVKTPSETLSPHFQNASPHFSPHLRHANPHFCSRQLTPSPSVSDSARSQFFLPRWTSRVQVPSPAPRIINHSALPASDSSFALHAARRAAGLDGAARTGLS